MLLHLDGKKHQIRVLLDTGCSIALLNNQTVERLDIPKKKHKQAHIIESYTGESVQGAGQFYTKPLLFQHQEHYAKEEFEISTMEADIDAFLPFDFIMTHPPQGAWTNEEVRFNSAECTRKCIRYETGPFPLTWDDLIATDPSARVLRYVSEAAEGNPLEAVPMEFRQYLGIMGKEAADALPEYRPYDCKIDLQEGSTVPWGPIYPLSEEELRTIREWLTEMERMGKIKRSTSPAGSPILFMPKPHGRGLRLCADYQALNRITIPNPYPLPLMQELQDRVQGVQWFTKMDLKNGFHLILIREGDEWKMVFRTRYGLFEFQVMLFGLTNAPSTFQDMMIHIFSDMLDMGTLAYMDDILVYADTEEKHDETVREVLKRLQNNGLAISPKNCVWKAPEVEFLGYIIGRNRIRMSEEKVEAILSWKTPESLTETQSFLGFAKFYRRFIQDYSRVARPLTELTKKEREWAWNAEADAAFSELKR